MKKVSGTIVKKHSDTEFIVITAAHVLKCADKDSNECELSSGMFILQAAGKGGLARFTFGPDDCKDFTGFDMETYRSEEGAGGLLGNDVAAIKCTLIGDGDIPVTELVAQEAGIKGSDATMVGYPEESILPEDQ